jgi:homoserine O-acetyltransferase
MVNFKKEFILEKFNIQHLKGLIGFSAGGFEVLSWAVTYPDNMDFVISLASTYKIAGEDYVLLKFMNNMIENDPEYNKGNYKIPLKSIGLANQPIYLYLLSKEFYRNQSYDEIDNELNEIMADFKIYDGNDVILRNNASFSYNIEDKLNKIIAKTLIVNINQDQYYPPELDGIPMSKMIKNSKLIRYDSKLGHVGIIEVFKIENDLKEFLSQI